MPLIMIEWSYNDIMMEW